MNNVADVRKMNKIKKKVYSFDKKGKRKEEVIEVDDLFMVTLKNGDQVALTEKQLKQYGIVFDKDEVKSEQKQVNIEDIDDDIVTDDKEIVTEQQLKLPLIETTEQVISSPNNEG